MKTQSTAVATTTKNEAGIVIVDLNTGALPDLSNAETYPFDLMADYWTPENKGEFKNVYFDKIAERAVLDQQTGDLINLECAYFFEQDKGEIKSISNGSKRLVGAIEASGIVRGTPLKITYMGKKNNKSNAFKSDNWSVKILKININ